MKHRTDNARGLSTGVVAFLVHPVNTAGRIGRQTLAREPLFSKGLLLHKAAPGVSSNSRPVKINGSWQW